MAKHSVRTPAAPDNGRQTRHAHLLPYPEFPLSPHVPSNRWYKKINGRRFYFGPLNDGDSQAAQAALDKYLLAKDDLYAGRVPRDTTGMLRIKDACNAFLTAKQRKVEARELTLASFGENHAACKRVIRAFGDTRAVADLTPADFERLRHNMARTLGPHALGKNVQLVRSLFKYLYDAELIDRPVRVGPEFKRPAAKRLRQARRERPARMFEAAEIWRMLKAADAPLKAMILLGVNVGYGNTDVARLDQDHLDLDAGVVTLPRPKTEAARRAILWPETIAAIKAALAVRPQPQAPADAKLIFITKYGNPWIRFQRNNPNNRGTSIDSIGLRFGRLLVALGIKREGVAYYSLRHTFRTIAGAAGDVEAVNLIMGHDDMADMGSRYVERIDNSRLTAVAAHVRKWFLAGKPKVRKQRVSGVGV